MALGSSVTCHDRPPGDGRDADACVHRNRNRNLRSRILEPTFKISGKARTVAVNQPRKQAKRTVAQRPASTRCSARHCRIHVVALTRDGTPTTNEIKPQHPVGHCHTPCTNRPRSQQVSLVAPSAGLSRKIAAKIWMHRPQNHKLESCKSIDFQGRRRQPRSGRLIP